MHFIYFDESKPQPRTLPYYIIGGIIIKDNMIQIVEDSLDDLSEEFFGAKTRNYKTEFHANDLIKASNHFQARDEAERILLFKKLLSIMSSHNIETIDIIVGTEKVRAARRKMPARDWALMYLVERVEELMVAEKSLALVSGDHDKSEKHGTDQVNNYKLYDTYGRVNRQINHVVDTLHHIHSQYSRLIQLADIYTYILMLRYSSAKKNKFKSELLEHYNSCNIHTRKIRPWY